LYSRVKRFDGVSRLSAAPHRATPDATAIIVVTDDAPAGDAEEVVTAVVVNDMTGVAVDDQQPIVLFLRERRAGEPSEQAKNEKRLVEAGHVRLPGNDRRSGADGPTMSFSPSRRNGFALQSDGRAPRTSAARRRIHALRRKRGLLSWRQEPIAG